MVKNTGLFSNTVAWVKKIKLWRTQFLYAHCILFLDGRPRQILNNSDSLDRIISTEIPGDKDHELQEFILKRNVHTLCEDASHDAVCVQQLDN